MSMNSHEIPATYSITPSPALSYKAWRELLNTVHGSYIFMPFLYFEPSPSIQFIISNLESSFFVGMNWFRISNKRACPYWLQV